MKQKKQNALSVLLGYAGSHRRLTLLGLGLSAVSMVCSMIPYLCIWLAARDLIAVAPDWTQAQSGAVDKVVSENLQWEFEQKKRRPPASFHGPYQPLQVQRGR